MGRKMIIANWKEHPASARDAERLFGATMALAARHRDVLTVVCPPALYLERLAALRKKKKPSVKVALGAQDVFWEEKGAFTGAVGPSMLRATGAEYVIIGHSERRKWFGDTDETVGKKVAAASAAGLKVILCIGEQFEVRKKGAAAAKRYLAAQLSYGSKEAIKKGLREIVVAYEPVWAIGTGRNDDPQDAADIAAFIRTMASKAGLKSVKVLYGGSVNGRDVRDYLAAKEIDGALIGGASIKVETLTSIFNHYE